MLTRQHRICTIPGSLVCILIPICLLLLSPPENLYTALSGVTNLEFFSGADDEEKHPLQQSQNCQRDELEDMIVLTCPDTHINTIRAGVSNRLSYFWIHPPVITPPPRMKAVLRSLC